MFRHVLRLFDVPLVTYYCVSVRSMVLTALTGVNDEWMEGEICKYVKCGGVTQRVGFAVPTL